MGDKKSLAIIGISSFLLLLVGTALTVGILTNTKPQDQPQKPNTQVVNTMNAIQAICQPTKYQQNCVQALRSANLNSTDPKDLIKALFDVAATYASDAARKSVTLKELHKDPRTSKALDDCNQLMGYSVSELRASVDRLGTLEVSKVGQLLGDLKTWLSAAITYQETCSDGFQNTTGDAGQKMRRALRTTARLTADGLMMVDEISSALDSFDFSNFRRRLLSAEEEVLGHGPDENISWMAGPFKRRLLAEMEEKVSVHSYNAGNLLKRKLMSESHMKWKPNKKKHRKITTPLKKLNQDIVIAKDGSGNYTTINAALKDIPFKGERTFVIYIKEGVYKEQVEFNKNMTNLFIVGDGPTKTRITFDCNFIDGTPTFRTATVAAVGENFMARDIGFENSAGADKHQAVALRVQSDKSVFYNCHMDGYQDTLYAHAKRQFYQNCTITGTIDFIFGDSANLFQNCTMLVRKPLDNQNCIVTAQGRKMPHQPTAIVLQNCTIGMDPQFPFNATANKVYLGRPWKMYSRAIVMESYIGKLIDADGWMPWMDDFGLRTCFYAEYKNRGPGSSKTKRVKWPGIKSSITDRKAMMFTAEPLLMADEWLHKTGVPFVTGMINITSTQ